MNDRKTHSRDLPSGDGRWQRLMLASSAIVFLVGGLMLAWLPLIDDGSRTFVSGTLLKVALVLGLTWLAAPQLERLGWQRLRGSLLVGVIIVLVLMTIRPRLGAIAGVLVIGGSLFFSLIGWFRSLGKPPRR